MTTTLGTRGARMQYDELLDAIDDVVDELGAVGACSMVNQLFIDALLTIQQHVEVLAYLRAHGYVIRPPGSGANEWVSYKQFI